jgi:hypothetical protein
MGQGPAWGRKNASPIGRCKLSRAPFPRDVRASKMDFAGRILRKTPRSADLEPEKYRKSLND